MRYIRYALILLIGILFILIGLFNNGKVSVNYLAGQQTIPLFLVMLLFFIFGALIALIVFGCKSMYWRNRAKSYEKQLNKLRDKNKYSTIEAEFQKDNTLHE